MAGCTASSVRMMRPWIAPNSSLVASAPNGTARGRGGGAAACSRWARLAHAYEYTQLNTQPTFCPGKVAPRLKTQLRRTVHRVHVEPEVAYRPLHALGLVEARRVLLDRHVGEVHKRVADVLLAHAEARVGEARETAPGRFAGTEQVRARDGGDATTGSLPASTCACRCISACTWRARFCAAPHTCIDTP